jgi:hypothetical protein
VADCATTGRPVNETSIGYTRTYVAGANDYNSYNGNADLGYYTSGDAKTWTDGGPLHLFPDGTNHAAGDPGVAIDGTLNVYYSGIFFDYFDCNVGGVELARYDSTAGTWSYYQIQKNSDTQFQDKPAIMFDGQRVFVSWTKYGSCTGVGVTSPIYVAVFPGGGSSVPPIAKLKVPGSTYSQGSAMAPDNAGGFWITWEEFPSPDATVGKIMLAHWKMGGGWQTPTTISPPGFTDLPSPLPGFAFRDNSFPAIALALQHGAWRPIVAWCSNDTGVGRAYLYSERTVTMLSDSGDDQFFPSIGWAVTIGIQVSWSQTNRAAGTFDQYLSNNGAVSKISTASSNPSQDTFFGGTFIGDYSGMAAVGQTSIHPIWTDLRRNDPQYGGKAQDAMVYA